MSSTRLPPPASRLPAVESLLEVMERRRSVRRLRSGPFTDEMLDRLLEAVRLTPSSYNLPPWRVVLVTERRQELWDEIEQGFRETLSEDRLERYLQRLDGFRDGVAVALVFVDRDVERELRGRGLEPEVAQSFVLQALGMVQYGLWLAITAEGLVASLQHWDHLVGPRLAHFAALPADQFALIATIPIGYAAEEPPPIARPDSIAVS
jgi:predicted oxidoreductase (fatty acid repression mutant protein)